METDNNKPTPQEIFDKSLNDSQYNVSPVPFHTHNGTDSPAIDLNDQTNQTTLVVGSGTPQAGALGLVAGTNTTVVQSGKNFTINVPTIGITTAYDRQVFTTAGAGLWTKPTGATTGSRVIVIAWGGGGGGGGANVTGGGGGGGGGEFSYGEFSAGDLNATVALVIGTGGAGGIGANPGSAGSDTTFATTLVVARHGLGGGADNDGFGGRGGIGGGYFGGAVIVGSIADAKDPFSGGAGGANDEYGNPGGTAYKGGGGGGNGTAGAGGLSNQGGKGGDGPSGNGNGQPGVQPAGGGSGARSNAGVNRTGGKGGDGQMIIWTIL